MNFQNIPPVEKHQFYIDLAFRRAREKGEKLRNIKLKGTRLEVAKYIEQVKMSVVIDTLVDRLEKILRSFPELDNLPSFYNELIRTLIDYRQFKKSLGALRWLQKQSKTLFKGYVYKLKKNTQYDQISKLKGEFLGRFSSLIKQVKTDFDFLDNARKEMKVFPEIKTSLKTVAIAGFPNVGKTTLLAKMTDSKPEINSYPFTTRGVNVANFKHEDEKIQLADTPGTLDRFEKMNAIEKMAYLVIEHCADIIVYVFDLTEEYPIDKQIKLYERIKKEFKKDIIIYMSKTDILEEVDIKSFKKKYPKVITDTDKLKDLIIKQMKDITKE